MRWVKSPSLFCVVTESARDLTQHFVDKTVALPHNPIENSMTIYPVPMRGQSRAPTKLLLATLPPNQWITLTSL
jgi:hypothetical protein